MKTYMLYFATGLAALWGCSRTPEPVQEAKPWEQNFQRLERKVDQLLQQEETEERVFLRNLKLLREYVSSHASQYDAEHSPDYFTMERDANRNLNLHTARYTDLKSWSKRTLDSFSSFFVDRPGER